MQGTATLQSRSHQGICRLASGMEDQKFAQLTASEFRRQKVPIVASRHTASFRAQSLSDLRACSRIQTRTVFDYEVTSCIGSYTHCCHKGHVAKATWPCAVNCVPTNSMAVETSILA